jgi:transcriptional adapter 2-alpha
MNGFMPLRNEFDYEDENTAELYLAHISFNENDTKLETEYKEENIRIYLNKLKDRKNKKEVIKKYAIFMAK